MRGGRGARADRLQDFTLKRRAGEVPAGRRGMEELAKRGLVRQATTEDIRSFEASGVKGIVRGVSAYVILKPITMPDGLYGADLLNILLPTGVPMPRGPRGGNFYFRYGQGECVGPRSCSER